MKTIKVDPHSYEGAFGLVVEMPGQDPFLIETEGHLTSRRQVEEMVRNRHGMSQSAIRYCIVRLVPVFGNTNLISDMIRMHPKPEDHEEEAF